ncbi:hypothetical protein [Rossellomorea vietnamensis]|uniref:hypothetical protein n=1 Tax=Rossellomorea vietnamensis TaxID=218284 RepID=UPI003D282E51
MKRKKTAWTIIGQSRFFYHSHRKKIRHGCSIQTTTGMIISNLARFTSGPHEKSRTRTILKNPA